MATYTSVRFPALAVDTFEGMSAETARRVVLNSHQVGGMTASTPCEAAWSEQSFEIARGIADLARDPPDSSESLFAAVERLIDSYVPLSGVTIATGVTTMRADLRLRVGNEFRLAPPLAGRSKDPQSH